MLYLMQACHPFQRLFSSVLTEFFEAAAARGLRLTYCTVNGHQVGAPAGAQVVVQVLIQVMKKID